MAKKDTKEVIEETKVDSPVEETKVESKPEETKPTAAEVKAQKAKLKKETAKKPEAEVFKDATGTIIDPVRARTMGLDRKEKRK